MIPCVVALLTAGVPFLTAHYAARHRYRGSSPAVFRPYVQRWEVAGLVARSVLRRHDLLRRNYRLVPTLHLLSGNTAWAQDKDGAKDFFFNQFLHLFCLFGYNSSPVWNVSSSPGSGVGHRYRRYRRVLPAVLSAPIGSSCPLVAAVRSAGSSALFLPGAADGLNALWT